MDTGRERQAFAAVEDESRSETTMLLEEVLRHENMMTAYRRIRVNKGSQGINGMTVNDLRSCLKEDWPRIKQQLLSGTYVPRPVKRVNISKPSKKGPAL